LIVPGLGLPQLFVESTRERYLVQVLEQLLEETVGGIAEIDLRGGVPVVDCRSSAEFGLYVLRELLWWWPGHLFRDDESGRGDHSFIEAFDFLYATGV